MTASETKAVCGLPISEPLLTMALTHKSYVAEHPGAVDNERLEFLGDAVIELAYTDYLYHTYPQRSEGELSAARAAAVSEPSLARFARGLGLGSHIRLGRGEEMSGGRQRDSLLADAFEAVVGAVYLEHGWDVAREFVISHLGSPTLPLTTDNKGRLQELLQASSKQTPSYHVLKESGPDHDKVFVVEVVHRGRRLGRGTGRSKKEAEQKAAEEALNRLQTRSSD
ncbi:MAG: ribonuclease III [Limnochordia bacterium]|jgi:ribonuclease-3